MLNSTKNLTFTERVIMKGRGKRDFWTERGQAKKPRSRDYIQSFELTRTGWAPTGLPAGEGEYVKLAEFDSMRP